MKIHLSGKLYLFIQKHNIAIYQMREHNSSAMKNKTFASLLTIRPFEKSFYENDKKPKIKIVSFFISRMDKKGTRSRNRRKLCPWEDSIRFTSSLLIEEEKPRTNEKSAFNLFCSIVASQGTTIWFYSSHFKSSFYEWWQSKGYFYSLFSFHAVVIIRIVM